MRDGGDSASFEGGPDGPFVIPTASGSAHSLVRVPQIIGLVAVVASVVILTLAIFAPQVFSTSSSQSPEIDIAQLQLTAEAQSRGPAPTSERSLSDLAPTVAPTETPTPTLPPTSTSPPAPGITATPPATPTPIPPTATPTIPPAAGDVKVGVALEEFPGSFEAITDFGQQSGRMPDMVMFFQAWGNSDRDFKDWMSSLDVLGVAPFITWEPWDRDDFIDQKVYTQESILAGEHDPYIDNWAERAAEYGNPIYLRFAHEMNTPVGKTYWYPWQGNPEQYIAVWQHVHDRFVAAGADNVLWVWSVAWMNDDAMLYYPGDDYVDVAGLTVLNFGEGKPDSTWRSFGELYSIQQSRVLAYGKPVMITELGTAEQGGDKGQWIADIGPDIEQRFPEIEGIVWLNHSESREFEGINWRVDSSSGALEGWRRLVNSAIFAGR
jgi:hypothetical protein